MEVIFQAGQQIERLQAVNPERLEKVVVGSEFFARHLEVARREIQNFIKPIPHEELRREIDIFCELFTQPAVEAGLRKFVESKDAQPYLP